jgi:hypothetical protein
VSQAGRCASNGAARRVVSLTQKPRPACKQTNNKQTTCSGTAASSLLSASIMWPQSRMGRPSSSIWWNTKSRNSFSRYLSPAPGQAPHPSAAAISVLRLADIKVLRTRRRMRSVDCSGSSVSRLVRIQGSLGTGAHQSRTTAGRPRARPAPSQTTAAHTAAGAGRCPPALAVRPAIMTTVSTPAAAHAASWQQRLPLTGAKASPRCPAPPAARLRTAAPSPGP